MITAGLFSICVCSALDVLLSPGIRLCSFLLVCASFACTRTLFMLRCAPRPTIGRAALLWFKLHCLRVIGFHSPGFFCPLVAVAGFRDQFFCNRVIFLCGFQFLAYILANVSLRSILYSLTCFAVGVLAQFLSDQAISQAEDPKPKIPSQRSQGKDPKPKIQSRISWAGGG